MADQKNLPEDQEKYKLNEVCKLANVQPYMLRFWGTEFSQLEAEKSGTGQRLYTRGQVDLILEIRRLLFDEGLTIAGARKRIDAMGEEEGPAEPAAKKKPAPKKGAKTAAKAAKSAKAAPEAPSRHEVDKKVSERVQPLLATLKDARDEIDEILSELRGE